MQKASFVYIEVHYNLHLVVCVSILFMLLFAGLRVLYYVSSISYCLRPSCLFSNEVKCVYFLVVAVFVCVCLNIR
jgi:hypothetical protein